MHDPDRVRVIRFAIIAIIYGGLVSAGSSWLVAADWLQWRGPNRDGLVEDFVAPATWPKTLKQLWRVEVGEGYSSPVQDNERLFIHARQGDEEWVRCLKLSTGELIWEARYPAPGPRPRGGRDAILYGDRGRRRCELLRKSFRRS